VAVNLAGVEHREIRRGSMLGLPGQWSEAGRLLVEFRPARYSGRPDKGSFQIHVGSGAWPARFRVLDETLAMVDLSQPLPLTAGDRFILRDSGRRMVVAGGRVLDPAPPRASLAVKAGPRLRAALAAGPDAVAGELLEMRGRAQAATLSSHAAGGRAVGAIAVGDLLLSAETGAAVEEGLRSAYAEQAADKPLREGLPLSEAAGRLGVSTEVATAIARRMAGLRVVDGRLTSDEPAPAPELEAEWKAARDRLAAAGLEVVPWRQLGIGQELVHALIRRGALVKVSDDVAYLPEQIEQVKEALRAMPPRFTVSQFKEQAGLSRKYAVPLLEWCDRQELTIRTGNERTVRPGALSSG
jgi:selenocysteine-specific elongation factor